MCYYGDALYTMVTLPWSPSDQVRKNVVKVSTKSLDAVLSSPVPPPTPKSPCVVTGWTKEKSCLYLLNQGLFRILA